MVEFGDFQRCICGGVKVLKQSQCDMTKWQSPPKIVYEPCTTPKPWPTIAFRLQYAKNAVPGQAVSEH
jgi:hypothetical protein